MTARRAGPDGAAEALKGFVSSLEGLDPRWAQALWAAVLVSVDSAGLGGLWIRAGFGPVIDGWSGWLRSLLPASAPCRRLPAGIADERLLGGLDLIATLQAGRPVAQRGVLAETHEGVLFIPMVERLPAGTAARLAAVMDTGMVSFERDGLSQRWPARVGLVALDEGGADDDQPPIALLERMAFQLNLHPIPAATCVLPMPPRAAVVAARRRLRSVRIGEPTVRALCSTALRLGIGSLRASQHAVMAARVIAALRGHDEVCDDDAILATQLVLAPRATVDPSADPPPEHEPPPPSEPPPQDATPPDSQSGPTSPPADSSAETPATALEDRLIDEVRAVLPAGLLAALNQGQAIGSAGRVGALSTSPRKGRPVGSRPGDPRAGIRLHLVDTLRAAAPWQSVRRRVQPERSRGLRIERDDLRVARLQQRAATATVFVIDASGSAALHRLGEAKGAVNLLLADCYVRRDQVAVIAFRGSRAELLLPPTRSLVRARRSLAALPGGGGTPLATGLEAAGRLAEQIRRAGMAPLLVVLTDGRANIARNGEPGRTQAEADAHKAARQLRARGIAALLVDTSPRPAAAGVALAVEMGAQYRALPHAGASELSKAVRVLTQPGA